MSHERSKPNEWTETLKEIERIIGLLDATGADSDEKIKQCMEIIDRIRQESNAGIRYTYFTVLADTLEHFDAKSESDKSAKLEVLELIRSTKH